MTLSAIVRRLMDNIVLIDSARILIVNVAGAGLAFLSHILFARWLTVASYGNYVFALSWLNVLAIVVQMGLNIAVVRLIGEYRASGNAAAIRRLAAHSDRVVLAAGVASAGLGAALIGVFLSTDSDSLRTTLYLMLGTTVTLGLFQQRMAILQGFERVAEAQVLHEIARPLLLLAATVVASRWDGFGAPVVMGLNLAATALLLIVLHRMTRRLMVEGGNNDDAPGARTWLAVGLPYLVISVVAIGLTQTDVLMIGSLLGTEAAGLYAPAAKIAMLVIFPAMAVRLRVAPMVSKLYAEGRTAAVQNRITVGTLAAFGTCVVGVLVILALRDIALGLFGDAYAVSAPVVVVLCLGYCVYTLGTGVETFLLMGPFERVNAAILLATLAVNLALNALLIPRLGMIGAAYATVGAMVIRAALSTAVVYCRTGILPLSPPRPETEKIR